MADIRRQEGFTLVEVMVAVTIFAIGLLALAAVQLQTIQGNSHSQGMTQATALGQGLIETMLGLDYDDPLLAAGAHEDASDPRYTLKWTVVDELHLANTKTIAVEVSWQEKGFVKKVALDCIKADII